MFAQQRPLEKWVTRRGAPSPSFELLAAQMFENAIQLPELQDKADHATGSHGSAKTRPKRPVVDQYQKPRGVGDRKHPQTAHRHQLKGPKHQ